MSSEHHRWMKRAIEWARRGEGRVEPNPMVGCVLVRDGELLGEGFHRRFGGPHAEVEAIQDAQSRGHVVAGATAYVTLEPCSHTGKTGPCSQRLIEEGIQRVIVGHEDPFPEVSGRGIEQLRGAGVAVSVGIMEAECRALNGPYLTRVLKKRPWVIAKWAMSLDGKIATRNSDSRWITTSSSRQKVQQLRGRVDGILVGRQTVQSDDPMLNARPHDPKHILRNAKRIVLDSQLSISPDAKLVRTADDAHATWVVCAGDADPKKQEVLEQSGCEVLRLPEPKPNDRLLSLMPLLTERGLTNLMIEGGGEVFGSFADLQLIDELHVFLGAKLIGGKQAPGPVAGMGIDAIQDASVFRCVSSEVIENDIYSVFRRDFDES